MMLSLRIVFPKVVGLLLILGATLPGLSQMTLQERQETADKLFELREYSQALPHYETILQNRYSVEIKDKTAICYALIGDNFKAAELHRQLAADMPDSVSYQMLYAESLMKTGQYVKAKAVFDKFSDDNKPARRLAKSCQVAMEITSSKSNISLRPLPFNSANDDFAPAITGDGIVFVSGRVSSNGNNSNEFTGGERYDIFYSNVDSLGIFSGPMPVEGGVNTKFNEGPATLAPNQKTAYFTRNSYHKGRQESAKPELKLAIYEAKVVDGKWKKARPFKFNNKEYSLGHPAISPDGNTLYFVSDMPGGQGGTDIWYSVKLAGEWTAPTNAGSTINTPGNESFPFVNAQNVLYFSSDWHPGLGGLDIFYIHLSKDKSDGVTNAGVPINSTADDYGIVSYKSTLSGYLTSNRDSEKGEGNLYFFWDKSLD